MDFLTLLTILFLVSFCVQQCKTLEDIHSRSHTGYLQIIFGSNILPVIPLWCAPHKLQSSSCNLQSFLVWYSQVVDVLQCIKSRTRCTLSLSVHSVVSLQPLHPSHQLCTKLWISGLSQIILPTRDAKPLISLSLSLSLSLCPSLTAPCCSVLLSQPCPPCHSLSLSLSLFKHSAFLASPSLPPLPFI